jgi:hypothetical protein
VELGVAVFTSRRDIGFPQSFQSSSGYHESGLVESATPVTVPSNASREKEHQACQMISIILSLEMY